MRVLVVHNRYRSAQPSGENGVVDEETRLLRERGVEVEQLTVESDEIAGWSRLRQAGLPARVVWSPRGAGLVRDAIDRHRPDLVHFHNTFPLLSPAALWSARRSGRAVVKTLHNFRPLCPAGMLFRDGRVCDECLGRTPLPAVRHGCYRGSRAATLPLAALDGLHGAARTWQRWVDTFITPSEFTRRTYIQAGWPEQQLLVKYNTAEDQPVRRDGAGDGFVCMARLGAEKGVDVLIEAWRRAFPDGRQRLSVIGSGELEADLRRQAEGVPGIEFCGQLSRNDALERVRRSRAVVVPSVWYEVFPRTVVEAYSLGVPVIASRLGSLQEVVRDGITGLLFEPGSADDLAAVLTAASARDELSTGLGAQARAHYEALLSPGATTDRLLEIYRGAVLARREVAGPAERPAREALGAER
jgi:glycosyltransferase involved in cell wall biosynthesis